MILTRIRKLLSTTALGLAVFIASPTRADGPSTDPSTKAPPEPKADTTGAYQMTPTPLSVPNYTELKDPASAKTEELARNFSAVAASTSRNFFSINFMWTLFAGFLVMFMQAGFALVETGLVRRKNAAHTMGMNFLVYGVGMIGFFVSGYALMCGGANGSPIGGPGVLGGIPVLNKMATISLFGHEWGLFGTKGFFLSGTAYDAMALTWFLFMMVFMDTTATIPTGALAERWKMKSLMLFSVLVGGFLYPIFGAWVWGGGWIAQLGLNLGLGHGGVDYAGSAVVHLQGGILALILTIMVGPRRNRYSETGEVRTVPAHNIPYVVLGTFILAFGWFGFNAGSSLAGTDGRISVIAVNTMLASATGMVVSTLYQLWKTDKFDIGMSCNGMLAGIVAITAPCAFVTPIVAALIGCVSGVLVIWSVHFWDLIKIDDPVGAISVHGVNGAWGILALGLFADGTYGAGFNGVGADKYLGASGQGVTGLFYGDSSQFVAQLVTIGACVAWNVVAGGLCFYLVGKVCGGNRVTAEQEDRGLDLSELGVVAYDSGDIVTESAPSIVPFKKDSNRKSA